MKALVKKGKRVSVQKLPKPSVKENDVLILVKTAGLCRMDIGIADGRIHSSDNIILGHEFSGIVEKVGRNVHTVQAGDRVVVNPLIPCRKCELCKASSDNCQHSSFLGLDRHGAFAEFACVTSANVKRIHSERSFIHAAFAEPIAASLSVLKTGISPKEKGLIYGDNRIARLTHKVLSSYGFGLIDVYDPQLEGGLLKSDVYDFAIEAFIANETLDELIKAVKPRGKIILKTRYRDSVFFNLSSAIKKEITLHCTNYGSFDEAVSLIDHCQIDFDDLVGDLNPLEHFEKVFKKARDNESKKLFFSFENESF